MVAVDRQVSLSSYSTEGQDYASTIRKSLQRCGIFIYNPTSKTFLGRTGKSWMLIILFYVCFFAYLIVIEVSLISVYYAISQRTQPYVTGQQNILRLTPGLQVVPHIDINMLTFIFSSNTNNNLYTIYSKNIQDFLANISFNHPKSRLATCDPALGAKTPNEVHFICPFDVSNFGPCAAPADVLKNKSICLFLTINNVFGYLPKLKSKDVPGPTIDCQGSYEGDKDNIKSIKYFPNSKGVGYFSHVYFPYVNQIGYKKPYVALLIDVEPAALIFLECTLGNVDVYTYRKFGSLKSNFEFVLDGPFI